MIHAFVYVRMINANVVTTKQMMKQIRPTIPTEVWRVFEVG